MSLNPVSYARMSAGLTKNALSGKLSLSRTFIIRAEQGCYETPGKKLGLFAASELNISTHVLQERYETFQHEKRIKEVEFRNPEKLGSKLILNGTFDFTLQQAMELPPSPVEKIEIYPHEVFLKWREDYWRTILDFAGTMCVHPSSVEQYESGKLNSMPVQIKDALESMNLIASGLDVSSRWFYGEKAA